MAWYRKAILRIITFLKLWNVTFHSFTYFKWRLLWVIHSNVLSLSLAAYFQNPTQYSFKATDVLFDSFKSCRLTRVLMFHFLMVSWCRSVKVVFWSRVFIKSCGYIEALWALRSAKTTALFLMQDDVKHTVFKYPQPGQKERIFNPSTGSAREEDIAMALSRFSSLTIKGCVRVSVCPLIIPLQWLI